MNGWPLEVNNATFLPPFHGPNPDPSNHEASVGYLRTPQNALLPAVMYNNNNSPEEMIDRARGYPLVQFSQCRAAFSASPNSLVVQPDLPLTLPSFPVDGRELHSLAPNRIKHLACRILSDIPTK